MIVKVTIEVFVEVGDDMDADSAEQAVRGMLDAELFEFAHDVQYAYDVLENAE
jgi:hypothetical protein